MSYGKITLIGRIGGEPETKYTPDGKMKVEFSLAVDRPGKKKEGDQPIWYRITAWDRNAESIDKLAQDGKVRKGDNFYLEGRHNPREYTNQAGKAVTSEDVSISVFQVLDWHNEDDQQNTGRSDSRSRDTGRSASPRQQRSASPRQERPRDIGYGNDEVPI